MTIIDTGNTFADAMIERLLASNPTYWALIDYLEFKGLLDRNEFLEFLDRGCREFVAAVERAASSPND